MTIAEERPRSIFGQIRLADMQGNEALTRTVLPLVKKALEHSDGRHTLDTIINGLASGRFQLWGAMRPPDFLQAVAVAFVDPYPSGAKAFTIMLLGGPDMAEASAFFEFLPQLRGEARSAGCDRMVIVGRKGWERSLPNWKAVAMIYEQRLEPR